MEIGDWRCNYARFLSRLRSLLAADGFLGMASVARGQVLHRHTMPSAFYEDSRRVWVYTPAGYDPKDPRGYDLIVAFDGADYRTLIPLPKILDSLHAAGAPPFVALLVDDGDEILRTSELGNSEKFAKYVGRELVPWLRQHYRVTRDPHRTIVTGSSMGGLAAAFVALRRPDLFGNVISQSGAFWRGPEGKVGEPYEWLALAYEILPRQDIHFVLDVGSAETQHVVSVGPPFIDAVRRFRDTLTAKGYRVQYTEIPGGTHAAATWRARLPGDIMAIVRGW